MFFYIKTLPPAGAANTDAGGRRVTAASCLDTHTPPSHPLSPQHEKGTLPPSRGARHPLKAKRVRANADFDF